MQSWWPGAAFDIANASSRMKEPSGRRSQKQSTAIDEPQYHSPPKSSSFTRVKAFIRGVGMSAVAHSECTHPLPYVSHHVGADVAVAFIPALCRGDPPPMFGGRKYRAARKTSAKTRYNQNGRD